MSEAAQAIDFDESWYLQRYPDVARAVETGVLRSALDHYLAYGREEGRRANGGSTVQDDTFDPDFYRKSYPLVRQEVDANDAMALNLHFQKIGRHRGYVQNRTARRPANAADYASHFGGLWIDLANAGDLIAGKQEIGMITPQEAILLQSFIRDGFVIMEKAVPESILDAAQAEVEAAYSGKYADLLFECHALGQDPLPWRDGVTAHAAKAIDLHMFSNPLRDLMFCAPVLRFLNLIFERPALASQSLSFHLGSGQPLHQDSAYVAYTLPLQFAASWIALEDVKPDGGELEYFVGSHRALPEFVYPGNTKSVSEANRVTDDAKHVAQEHRRHLEMIQIEGAQRNLPRARFLAKRGDVLIWHSDLAHGGAKVAAELTRKSVVTHYCPKEVCPLFRVSSLFKYAPGAYFTSGAYLDMTTPG